MKQRKVFSAAVLLISLFFLVFVFGTARAQYGLDEIAGEAGLTPGQSRVSGSVQEIIGNIVGAGLSLVSIIFFGLMIYGGVRWMMAQGEEAESKKALDTIKVAVIGIIVVLASYAITSFVLGSISKGD